VPFLPPLADDEAVPESRAALQSLQAKLGSVPNMYRTFAHAPKVLSAAVTMAQAIRSELSPRIRELAYLKVTELTRCHVCEHYHVFHGKKAGLTDRHIAELG
jgi:AhpD family alkylhydroperoxidase